MNATGARPDPDQVLARVQREQAQQQRGRLKVWLGAAPGVGKTFAMLGAARRRQLLGEAVLVGWVETHGRAETAELLHGLAVLPPVRVRYEGRELPEFDLEEALRRAPRLLLVDELAHTNVPGSRFPKRWQDVEVLCAAGIDVETTLNVQHLESLVDVVQQVTGVRVRETVPDHVLAGADEVVLVDLPPEALIERLRAGKVYAPEAAAAALAGFFRRSNLAALRELALRHTAAWVDTQLQGLRRAGGVRRIWGTSERVLVAVGPSPLSGRLVRAAHRHAASLRAELFAVFVEAPGAPLSPPLRERVAAHLRLAESLGARTATLAGRSPAAALLAFARQHDIARVVIGKSGRPRWRERLFGSVTAELIRDSGELDVLVVRAPADDDDERADGDVDVAPVAVAPPVRWREVGEMLAWVAVAVGVAAASYAPGDLATEAMVLVLGIVVVSLRCGRRVATAAVLLSAAAFNFLFTEPRWTFAIADPGYVVAFVVMLVVGLTVSTLVQRVRASTEAAREREHEVARLYSLVRELAAADRDIAVAQALVGHVQDVVAGDLVVLLPQNGVVDDPGCVVAARGVPDWLGAPELALARWCFDRGLAAGAGTSHLPGSAALFLPMVGPRGRVGVFGCRADAERPLSAHGRALLATALAQAATAIERLRAQAAERELHEAAAKERLRSTLLASVSHDLRTPLASITGAASSLLDDGAELPAAERTALLAGIVQESQRLNELIANLLFATRLDAGDVVLRSEWTSLEEIVGAAVRRARAPSAPGRITVTPPVPAAALPLVQADPVLLEQCVFLLLDNALRHTQPGTAVAARLFAADGHVGVDVHDDGPGVPLALRARLFQRFERGERSGGLGLGLAIAAAIARAHGGSLRLCDDAAPGATFRLQLPVPAQPRPLGPELEATATGDDA